MSNLVFNGKISKILPLAKGEGRSGEWAKASFEVGGQNQTLKTKTTLK